MCRTRLIPVKALMTTPAAFNALIKRFKDCGVKLQYPPARIAKRIDRRCHDLKDVVASHNSWRQGNSPNNREYSLVPYF